MTRDGATRSGVWAFASLVVSFVVGAAGSLFAAHWIGSREVGTFGIAVVVLATVDALTASGADTALITHPGDPETDLDLTFSLRMGQGVLGALLMLAAAAPAGAFFDSAPLPALIRALAIVPLARGAANPAAILLVRRSEFRRLFWWGLPEQLVGAAVVVGVALLRRDAWALAAAMIATQLAAMTMSYVMVPRAPRLTWNGPGMSRLLHFGRWTQATRVLMFIGLYLDNALVGKLLGASALGFYQVAFRIGEIPIGTLGRAAAQVMLPALTKLRPDPAELRRQYDATVRLVVAAHLLIAFAIVVVARPLITRVLGASWEPAVAPTQILAVAMVLRNVMQLGNQLLYAVERPRLVFEVNAVRIVVMGVTILPLLQRFGLRGVALSVLLSCLGAVVAGHVVIHRKGASSGAPSLARSDA